MPNNHKAAALDAKNLDPVRWGVLSASNFALKVSLPGMKKGALTSLRALASRDLGKSKAAAQALGIPKAYGTYEELLADPEIEAIYNPLPNHLHVEWTARAARAGKHVLCEKPIALTAEEAEVLLAAQRERQAHLRGVHGAQPSAVAAARGWSRRAASASCSACRPIFATSTATPPTSATSRTSAAARSTTSAATRS